MILPRQHLELRRAVTRFLDGVQALPGWEDAFAALPTPPAAAAEMSFSELQWAITERRPSEPPLDTAALHELRAYEKALAKFAQRYLCGTVWGSHAVHDARRLRRRVQLPEGRDRWVQLTERFEFALGLEARQPYPASHVLDAADMLRATADAIEAAIDFSAQDRHQQEKMERLDAMERALPEPTPHQRPHPGLSALRKWRKQNTEDATLPQNWQARLEAAIDVIAAQLRARHGFDDAERQRFRRARQLLDMAVTAGSAAPLDPADLRDKFFGPYLDLMEGLAEAEEARRRQA